MWPNVTSVTLFFRLIRWCDRQINVDQAVTPLAFSLQLMKPRFFESQIIWARGVSWRIANYGDFCTFSTAVDPTGLTYLQRHLVTRAIFKNFDSPIILNLTAKRRNKVQSSQSKTFFTARLARSTILTYSTVDGSSLNSKIFSSFFDFSLFLLCEKIYLMIGAICQRLKSTG